jgi:hypothetical protein
MNRKNFQTVLDKIKSDPDSWYQASYHCGTTHCFAGWAQILSGNVSRETLEQRAAELAEQEAA